MIESAATNPGAGEAPVGNGSGEPADLATAPDIAPVGAFFLDNFERFVKF